MSRFWRKRVFEVIDDGMTSSSLHLVVCLLEVSLLFLNVLSSYTKKQIFSWHDRIVSVGCCSYEGANCFFLISENLPKFPPNLQNFKAKFTD